MQVRLYFLNHGHLLTSGVKCDVERVNSAEKAFENLHGVAAKAVSLVLCRWVTILENAFAIAVINRPQFISAEHLEGLADLAEGEVGGGLALQILLGVVGEREFAECNCDLLERGFFVKIGRAHV